MLNSVNHTGSNKRNMINAPAAPTTFASPNKPYQIIYRNTFLKNIVSQYVCNDLDLNVSFEYLNHHHQDLARLDTLNYNTQISVLILDDEQSGLYQESPYKDLITKMFISDAVGPINQSQIYQHLPKNLKSLEFTHTGREITYGENIKRLLIDYRSETPHGPYNSTTLPKGLKSLSVFGPSHPFTENVIPDSLTDLQIASDDLVLYNASKFPSTLTYVELNVMNTFPQRPVFNNQHFIKKLDISFADGVTLEPNDLPSTVESLSLGGNIGELRIKVLPQSITELELNDYAFQLKPNILPSHLKKLSLYVYDQPLLVGVLPQTLKELTLHLYDKPIGAKVLPSSLSLLRLPSFNQPLSPKVLPNITDLYLPTYCQPIEFGVFPDSVKTLLISHALPISDSCQFPSSLTRLEITNFDGSRGFLHLIPPQIKSLYIDFFVQGGEQKIEFDPQAQIPPHITSLLFGHNCFRIPQSFIPPTVKKLTLGSYETVIQPTVEGECFYPPHLELLSVTSDFKVGKIPDSLKIIHFNDCILQHIKREGDQQ
ncbi:hypothetical protein CYY_006612 [Polysphondylium violaceum]|uniref:FNIP repeat-containing protein n=1 Tax=Polysphondylium violaceum TaxID=133409 RepID=A0A8J4PQ22_9MYCE|nr:hypothetical protein CYY_006612 [Polysphondylium violaceum]